jgi:hypothetical protein
VEVLTTVEHEARQAHAAALTRFPSPELVTAAAGLLPAAYRRPGISPWLQDVDYDASGRASVREAQLLEEGPRFFATVTAGTLELSSCDLARKERRLNRLAERSALEMRAPLRTPLPGLEHPPTRRVRGWSAQSRRNLIRVLAGLDFAPLLEAGTPSMVTLTYPADWKGLAPDVATAKRHLGAFRRRYQEKFRTTYVPVPPELHRKGRRWHVRVVEPVHALWKMEFQRRGAPHFHLLLPLPLGIDLGAFRAWCRQAWSDVVFSDADRRGHAWDPLDRMNHEAAGANVDMREGARMNSPERIAAYFVKRESFALGKEYQHAVPAQYAEGVGRFWGIWGLGRPSSAVQVEVEDFVKARRLVRRYARSRGLRRVARGGRLQGCWITVPDGPAFAYQLARALALE